MNYELAKQLKEAGYTGEFDLSSLIKACGDGFGYLINAKAPFKYGAWLPHYPEWRGRQFIVFGEHWINEGNTPEEAVAKTWLALKQTPKE